MKYKFRSRRSTYKESDRVVDVDVLDSPLAGGYAIKDYVAELLELEEELEGWLTASYGTPVGYMEVQKALDYVDLCEDKLADIGREVKGGLRNLKKLRSRLK